MGGARRIGGPQKDKNDLTLAAFTALAKEGFRIDGEQELFTIGTVARVSRVLRPWVDRVFDELDTYVRPIGEKTDFRMIPGRDRPRSNVTRTRRRAVWVNVVGGVKRLALATDSTTTVDGDEIAHSNDLDFIPDRMVRLAIRQTERKVGPVETVDSWVARMTGAR